MADLAAARQLPQITGCTLVRPLPPIGRFILRGGPLVMAAAGNALGLAISQTVCRSWVNVNHAALCLGPDEHLLLGPDALEIAGLLEPALHDLSHSLVDVSHRQTALEISGSHAALALNAGCPLDLDRGAFPVGMCTRTVLAKAEIVLWRIADDRFHVEVWRSFATYVSRFLAEAAREWAPESLGAGF
jgi:sarcosine oxidase subunit gamma